tara:strand:- start:114 stop:1466 length:1353 start_codon:yes stop_codon:yes gene_type:complete
MVEVSAQSQGIQTEVGGLVENPDLPAGSQITAQLQNVGVGEDMATSGVSGTSPTAGMSSGQAAIQTNTGTGTAATVGGVTPTTSASYTAQTGTNAPQSSDEQLATLTQPAVGASGSITSQATVQGQLENITQDIESALAAGTNLPAFARGAQKMAMAAMAQRGLSASTIAADAVAEGVLRASTQIAAADAQSYKEMIFQNLSNRQQAATVNAQNFFQMDMANLSNRQQTELANTQIRQQFLLSDQAAVNASKQFNATNKQQTDQFFANLNTSIKDSNAKRADAMTQVNITEQNKINALNAKNVTAVSEANAARQAALNQFNTSLKDTRDKFNVENQRVIDQSNVEWRRAINTANTAATNAANQTNAQNKLDLSNYAMNALWQQWRDEASWANTGLENDKNRAHNMAIAALERSTTFDIMDEAQKNTLIATLGDFAFKLWGDQYKYGGKDD